MTIQTGFNLINNVLTDTFIFNISWLISILLLLFTLLIITRDTKKWGGIAFPIVVMWHVIGITPSILLYIVTAIFFVVDVLSIETIGNILTGNIRSQKNQTLLNKAGQGTRNLTNRLTNAFKDKNRTNKKSKSILDKLKGL